MMKMLTADHYSKNAANLTIMIIIYKMIFYQKALKHFNTEELMICSQASMRNSLSRIQSHLILAGIEDILR